MSTKYSGGLITKNPVTPAGPYQNGAAPGVWTVEQALQYTKQGIWPIAGNQDPTNIYIEYLFSTYLYTGTGASQTITNGIDLSTKGGLVWFKSRSGAYNHALIDTARGGGQVLSSNTTSAQADYSPQGISAFNTNGFTFGTTTAELNNASNTYVSWTFREQAKFFDIVTWTGNGTAGRVIPHNLGSTPGCIFVKRVDGGFGEDWYVYHRSLSANQNLVLNTTAAAATGSPAVFGTVDSTGFQLNNSGAGNSGGYPYIAYLFAHNAGGFGTSGSENVISCGSYTGTASTDVTVNLGYEPQWVMIKRTNSSGSPAWWIGDTMRGLNMQGINRLEAWDSAAEGAAYNGINPTSTGFVLPTGTVLNDSASSTYIYIAIRRGPMAVPTSGTSVFNALSRTGTAATATVSTTILPDLVMSQARGGMYNVFYDRLRGAGATLSPNLGSDAESVVTNGITAFNNTSYTVGSDASQNRINWNTYTYANWLFSRAPSFFDEVCYTGTGTYGAANHNLGVTPELIIYKSRSNAVNWGVIKLVSSIAYYDGLLNSNSAFTYYSNDPSVAGLYTSTQFCKYQDTSSYTYVAYLFATCAGVSKVGSYTGTGATQTINCGFGAGGSRFVLIKRTDSTGDWYVWDSARGMVSGTDPSLLLNSTAAEVNANSIYTISTGFQIVSTAAGINASGGTYIFLSIA